VKVSLPPRTRSLSFQFLGIRTRLNIHTVGTDGASEDRVYLDQDCMHHTCTLTSYGGGERVRERGGDIQA